MELRGNSGSSKTKIESNAFRLKRWTEEEHWRFLEGLKLYGKNWPKVQRHVSTKAMKNVISHGQKFNQRLSAALAKNKTLPGLSEEETLYFATTLSQHLNRNTLEKEQKVQKTLELQEKGCLFRVDKIRRRKRKPAEKEVADSEYARWKAKLTAGLIELKSFHFSLGASILKQTSNKGLAKTKTRFGLKNSLSSETLSNEHSSKFSISDELDFLKGIRFTQTPIFLKTVESFTLDDLPSPNEDTDLMIKIGNMLDARVVDQVPLSFLMRPKTGPIISKLQEKYPNLYVNLWNRAEERIESNCPTLYTEDTPLIKILKHYLKPENEEAFANVDITFYYQKRK